MRPRQCERFTKVFLHNFRSSDGIISDCPSRSKLSTYILLNSLLPSNSTRIYAPSAAPTIWDPEDVGRYLAISGAGVKVEAEVRGGYLGDIAACSQARCCKISGIPDSPITYWHTFLPPVFGYRLQLFPKTLSKMEGGHTEK